MRFRIFVSESIGFFIGSGPFYEYEKWNYNCVPDEKLPADRTAIITSYTKSGSYVSLKWFTSQDFDFDVAFTTKVGTEIFLNPQGWEAIPV